MQVSVCRGLYDKIIMCINKLLAVTGNFVKNIIDVFNGNLIVRIGNGSVTVLLFLQL